VTPPAAWYATMTPRWHAGDSAPWLSSSGDTVASHGARMAILARLTWPDVSADLLWACAAHDLGEADTGDAPLQAKRDLRLKAELDRLEGEAMTRMGVAYKLTPRDEARLKYLDRLDAYLWAQHHAPELMSRADWQASRAWLHSQSAVLVAGAA